MMNHDARKGKRMKHEGNRHDENMIYNMNYCTVRKVVHLSATSKLVFSALLYISLSISTLATAYTAGSILATPRADGSYFGTSLPW